MLKAHDIVLGYNNKALVNTVNFSLSKGEICAVIGHNGSGKTTLVRTLMGLHFPLSGHFEWHDQKKKDVAYLGQNTLFDSNFPLRVKDVVAMGSWDDLGFWASIDQSKADHIDHALIRTGLTAMADRPLYECSSGQLQRCFFARAIVQNSPLILLDEPFSTIDQTTEAKLVEIIQEWRDEGRAIMIVLHDLSAVMGISDTCLLLGNGKASYGPTKAIVTTENLMAHRYLSQTQADWLTLLQEQREAGND